MKFLIEFEVEDDIGYEIAHETAANGIAPALDELGGAWRVEVTYPNNDVTSTTDVWSRP